MGAQGGAKFGNRQPGDLENVIHGFFKDFPAFGVGCSADLGKQAAASGMVAQDQFDNAVNGFLEGTAFDLIVIFSVFFADLDNGFDAKQGGEQTAQMTDAAAGDQILEIGQGELGVHGLLHLIEFGDDLIHRAVGLSHFGGG